MCQLVQVDHLVFDLVGVFEPDMRHSAVQRRLTTDEHVGARTTLASPLTAHTAPGRLAQFGARAATNTDAFGARAWVVLDVVQGNGVLW